MPLKPLGSVSGSFNSPRAAMKIRFGDSANTPGCEPQMYPFGDQVAGQFSTTVVRPRLFFAAFLLKQRRRSEEADGKDGREREGNCSHEDLG